MPRPKHIYWFAYYSAESPSVRYRALMPLSHLRERFGITHSVVFPGYRPAQLIHFLRIWLSALLFPRRQSVIVFQKIYTRGIYATLLKMLLRLRARRSYYDIDDAEYIRFTPHTLDRFLRRCAGVGAASDELAAYAKQHNPNVHLITSPVFRHPHQKQKRNEPLTLGWIGYFNAHRSSMSEYFFPTLSLIDFQLKVELLGVNKPHQREEVKLIFAQLPHITLVMPDEINWMEEGPIYERMSTWDAGISTLTDEPFLRAKSAFKLKQYMSCGLPVLASPVGENKKWMQQGLEGFFCESPQAFASAILKLKSMSPDEYQQMCLAAHRRAQDCTIEKFAEEWLTLWENETQRRINPPA